MGQSSTAHPSFEAFGLRSGMTPNDVSKQFPNYELRWLAQPKGSAVLGTPNGPDIYAIVTFCNNRLWGVARDVDPDKDFLSYVQDYMREYGQPAVNIEKHAWTRKTGGDITSLELQWSNDGVYRTVNLVPEGRTGTGEVRYPRGGSVNINFSTPCK